DAFDLGRPNAVPGRINDVVLASSEVEVSFLVGARQVAGQEPITYVLVTGRFRVLPVPKEHDGVGPGNRDLAQGAGCNSRAGLVNNGDVVAGIGTAHAA